MLHRLKPNTAFLNHNMSKVMEHRAIYWKNCNMIPDSIEGVELRILLK